jgi:hypothetical protein
VAACKGRELNDLRDEAIIRVRLRLRLSRGLARRMRPTGLTYNVGVCMQCVAQSAPFVGVAFTVMNRRNLKNFVADTMRRKPRTAAPQPADRVEEAPATDVPIELAAPTSGDLATELAEPVGAGV